MANQIRVNTWTEDDPDSPADYDKLLEQALADRERFLRAHPDYIPYQRQIDRILSKAGTSENRMAVLAVMMEAKINELAQQFQDLAEIVSAAMMQHCNVSTLAASAGQIR